MNWHKFFIINAILIIIIIVCVEIYNYINYKSKYIDVLMNNAKNTANPQKDVRENLPKYVIPVSYNYKKHIDSYKYRSPGNSLKRPVITIGCSYAYGILLGKEYTLAGQLNEITDRVVYNLGISATGPQIVYEQLSDPNIKKEIPDAEYIIYVFIHNHIMRQFMTYVHLNGNEISPQYYIDNNGNFAKRKMLSPKILYTFFSVRNYLDKKMFNEETAEKENGIPLFLRTMEEAYKAAKKNYPDSKFVLLEFPQGSMCNPNYYDKSQELSDENIKQLEKIGIIYINAEQLVGHKFRDVEKYRIADKDHPNAKVWKEIAPALKTKLNL